MRANRILLPALYAALAGCGGVFGGAVSDHVRQLVWPIAAAATPADQVVTANEFDLIDKSGTIRGKLFMKYADTPALTLYDIRGKETVSLSNEASPQTDEACCVAPVGGS
jgi:hypothetical protein